MDNSCLRITIEECDNPPLSSCSNQCFIETLSGQKKRTKHLLRNRTMLLVDNRNSGDQELVRK